MELCSQAFMCRKIAVALPFVIVFLRAGRGLAQELKDMYIALICTHRSQQLPQLGRGDVESHCELLAHRLHSDHFKFIVVVPQILQNPDNILYPFHSSILNTTAVPHKDPDVYFSEVKSILTGVRPKPNVIWSFGEHPVQWLGSLGIPMIITIPSFPRAHALQRGQQQMTRFRFFSDDSLKKWLVHNPWISNEQYHVVIHDNLKEIPHMVRASMELISSSRSAADIITAANSLAPSSVLISAKANDVITAKASEKNSKSVKSSPLQLSKQLSSTTTVQSRSAAADPSKNIYLQQPSIIAGQAVAISNTTSSDSQFRDGFIVGTMTTTPKRLKEVSGPFGETINNLLSFPQLDRLYLNIPWQYGVRKKSENVTLSSDLMSLIETSKGRLRILRSVDYGPATKLLPTLLLPDAELPPNSMIITFDDDRIYTASAVKALVEQSVKRPDTVITIAAWPISILSSNGKRGKKGGPMFHSKIPRGKEGTQYTKAGSVDLILGFYGVLYRKKFFTKPTLDLELFNYAAKEEFTKYCAWVDDIWFSGHLERLKIPKYAIGNVRDTRAGVTSLSNVNALSLDQGESVKQNHDNVLCAEAMRAMYGIWEKAVIGHGSRKLWSMSDIFYDYVDDYRYLFFPWYQ